MPNTEKVPRDDHETYDEVIEPMLEKISKVCHAFEIPFLGIFQPVTNRDNGDVIRGQTFTPKHTALNVSAAAFLLGANDQNDLSERIMRLAAYVMTKDLSGGSSNRPHPLADLFAQMSGTDEDSDKVVN